MCGDDYSSFETRQISASFLISSKKEDYHHGWNEPLRKGKCNFLSVFFVLIAGRRVNEEPRYYGRIETNLFSFHFHLVVGNVYTCRV